MKIYFSDVFGVSPEALDEYGAFNISLVSDLPLFVDPFLLFNSGSEDYRKLHDQILDYLRFLKSKAQAGQISKGLLGAWFFFPEVKQTWLGYSQGGNAGAGLGKKFAMSLEKNLVNLFKHFGSERVTKGSHLEKLCLIESGVGRDCISDFTTNLIKGFLAEYTSRFAQKHIDPKLLARRSISKARFNYSTETWEHQAFLLPIYENDFVLLAPKDILTRDNTWINRADVTDDFWAIAESIPNEQLRAQLNNYIRERLPAAATRKDMSSAVDAAMRKFPELVDHYIRFKENTGDEAVKQSQERVAEVERLLVTHVQGLVEQLRRETGFYRTPATTRDEAMQRVIFLKDVVENKGGHRFFYVDGEPMRRETDLHVLYRLTWFGSPSDVSAEVNDGRGPVDFKGSRGAFNKSLVEFKLAKNTGLKRNLQHQTEVYKKASDATSAIKVIVYFTEAERDKVLTILSDLKIDGDRDIVLIDARADNKPPGSKAKES